MTIKSLENPQVEWLTSAEVTEATGIPQRTLRTWASGDNSPVRHRRLGRTLIWLKEDLTRLLEP